MENPAHSLNSPNLQTKIAPPKSNDSRNPVMKTILSTLILALAAFPASADVLIYRSTERFQLAGDGQEVAISYKGYWIIDLATTNVTSIHWSSYRGQKWSEIVRLQYPLLFKVDGKNRSFSFLTEAATSQDQLASSSVFIKGQNQTVTIGTGRTGLHPRTMSGKLQQVAPGSQSHESHENTLSFSYAQSMTATNNDAGNSVQTILNRIVGQLEATGYHLTNP